MVNMLHPQTPSVIFSELIRYQSVSSGKSSRILTTPRHKSRFVFPWTDSSCCSLDVRPQTLLLDHRQHSIQSVSDYPYLKQTQGPALLAHNDGLLQEKDWTALREIHRSSKATDFE